MDENLTEVAALLRQRNGIDASIAQIIDRPVTAGHLGEWIASRIFGIKLATSAANQGFDGVFQEAPLAGKTVNVKWYMKRTGLLDTTTFNRLNYYLVLTGPPSPAGSSRGLSRPWCVEAVFLFDAAELGAEQVARGVRQGIASSVPRKLWDAAQVYPEPRCTVWKLPPEQVRMLRLFHPDSMLTRPDTETLGTSS